MSSTGKPSAIVKFANLHIQDNGTPVANDINDVYFSSLDGYAETMYVFLKHNGLPERWQGLRPFECFQIAETGFGTGLNFLIAAAKFIQHAPSEARLHFTSFEYAPVHPSMLEQALATISAQHPDLQPWVEALTYQPIEPISGCQRRVFAHGRVTLDVWVGDIHHWLPDFLSQLRGSTINAWFLDGFAPDKNPDMWQPTLFKAMAQASSIGTTVATFTAAGFVRRELNSAGFSMHKAPGFGRKREMIYGEFTQNPDQPSPLSRSHTIIGGGIAAATLAHALRRRGCEVTVISAALAEGASGNPQAAVYPLLQAQATPTSQFYLQAFFYARSFYQTVTPHTVHFDGLQQLAFKPERAERQRKILELYDVGSCDTSSTPWLQGQIADLLLPTAGWLEPANTVAQLLPRLDIQAQVVRLEQSNEALWQIHLDDGRVIESEQVTIAGGADAHKLLNNVDIELQPVRGQITVVESDWYDPQVYCHKGYITPNLKGRLCIGATFDRIHNDHLVRAVDDAENWSTVQCYAPDLAKKIAAGKEPPRVIDSRASVRSTTYDHLPVVGNVEGYLGLSVFSGLGSRGFTSAPLLAELLAAHLCGEPLSITEDSWRRLQPARFTKR